MSSSSPDAEPRRVDSEVCALVHRFAHRLDEHVRVVASELGMTPAQVIALRELSAPITARELAHRMSCEPSNATFVLDRLEQHGLLRREPHPHDRRAKRIVLTTAGRQSRESVIAALDARPPMSRLTTTQQTALRDLLRTLVAD